MWIYTTFGMFSVVEDKDDKRRVVVRARCKEHLHQLLARAGEEMTVILTPEADYACRVFVTRKKWERILLAATRAIDYTNFKNACEVRVVGSRYKNLLTKIWEATWSALSVRL